MSASDVEAGLPVARRQPIRPFDAGNYLIDPPPIVQNIRAPEPVDPWHIDRDLRSLAPDLKYAKFITDLRRRRPFLAEGYVKMWKRDKQKKNSASAPPLADTSPTPAQPNPTPVEPTPTPSHSSETLCPIPDSKESEQNINSVTTDPTVCTAPLPELTAATPPQTSTSPPRILVAVG